MVFGHASYVNELKLFPSLWSRSFATACSIKTKQKVQTKSQQLCSMPEYSLVSRAVQPASLEATSLRV